MQETFTILGKPVGRSEFFKELDRVTRQACKEGADGTLAAFPNCPWYMLGYKFGRKQRQDLEDIIKQIVFENGQRI